MSRSIARSSEADDDDEDGNDDNERTILLAKTATPRDENNRNMGVFTSFQSHAYSRAPSSLDLASSDAIDHDSIALIKDPVDVELADKKPRELEEHDEHDEHDDLRKSSDSDSEVLESGVGKIEAARALWGRKGRWLVILGAVSLALVMIIYEIDNTTVSIYNNYATSSFSALSRLATLSTATAIVFAVVKPLIAKLSNVVGRGEAYIVAMSFYVLGYVLMASSASFNAYAAGAIFYAVGQSGTNIMNDIIVADITTARWRGFAISFLFFPFLITPWAAGFIVDDVVRPGGIGWRWGIGMFAILMPISSAVIISTLLYYQRRAKNRGLVPRKKKTTLHGFCSQIDLGGSLLLCAGFAMVLVPLTLAANSSSGSNNNNNNSSSSSWGTPYTVVLVVIGGLVLAALPFYEKFAARNPILPPHYFRNRTIALCLFLIASDSIGFSSTHTYLYSWATVARGFTARDATFFQYTHGVMQCVTAITGGLAMAYTRRYKWLLVSGATVRFIGYGVMLRLRGAENSVAEIFIVQVIQGLGSGFMQLSILVPAQIVVPHREMPQVTALVICFAVLGSSIGGCVAGAIYSNTFKPALYRYLGAGASSELVDSLFDSIVGTAPAWGTPERNAINHAFTDVMKYMVYAAVGASTPGVILVWLLPNYTLPDRNNIVET
ncbi:ENB1 protein [Colletotrichum higginsianum IMI 349063]|uniref:ENB1 protein n=2 Tax=Colletotrichum higginsianum (strain IMI 349063) TaxID=759273 RepID=A0A1B7YSI1_COLHI|nr:ENB1 protein [Colletotrichum higginsianum IMI 349063]OBR14914.1 ENB1 protein [Colletotrichum higginsianum IMI 349063]